MCRMEWSGDMTEAIERQIERFAPGFRECVLARSVSGPGRLEAMDENLRPAGTSTAGCWMCGSSCCARDGGAIGLGRKGCILCSASTPPGGGVHGMCGFHAAEAVIKEVGTS